MSTSKPRDVVAIGIGMMLVAYFLFSTVDVQVKWLLGLGIPAMQLAFLRYAGQFLICLGIAVARPERGPRLDRRTALLTVLRSSFLLASTMGNFVALQYLPLTITSAIMFSAPIIVCILSMPLLGERVGAWRWSAIVVGFLGVIIIVQPFGAEFHWAALLSVFNATAMALYAIMTRFLVDRVSPARMQLYTGALGTFALLPIAWVVWETPPAFWMWGPFAALGLAAWAGHELLTRAHKVATANMLAPFTYSLLIYMSFYDVVLFGLVPSMVELMGIAIIIAAGLVIWKRGRG